MEAPKLTRLAQFGVLAGSAVAVTTQSLDVTIAAVALPHMQGSLSASQDEINWVITSYITAAAIMTAPSGWLADRFGRKRVMVLSMTGFILASVLTGFATSVDQIVLFRLLQGMCGAPLMPLCQAALMDAYEPKDQQRALSYWMVASVMGPVMGPNLGGWITDHWNWRWVFFINVPIGAVCLLLLILFLPETKPRHRDFDWFGFGAFSLFVGCFQLTMDRGSGQDWFGSNEIIAEACLAGLGLYTFIVHSKTTSNPFIDFSLLLKRSFGFGTVFTFLVTLLLTASLILLPSFLENLMGDPVGTAGGLMSLRSIGAGTTMLIAGRIAFLRDAPLLPMFGLSATALSMYLMSRWSLNVSSLEVSLVGLMQGIGIGTAFASVQGMNLVGLSPKQRNGAASITALSRNFGQSIGSSVAMTLLIRNTQVNHAEIVARVTPFNHALQSGSAKLYWNWHDTAARMTLDGEITRQASLIAFNDDFRILMFISFLAIPMVLLARTWRKPTDKPIALGE